MKKMQNNKLEKTLFQPEKPALFHLLKKESIIGFLLLATLIYYHPAWKGQLIWDDDHHITRPELRSINGLVQIWRQPGTTQQYYPFIHSMFWLEQHLWGESPLGYHLLNILLHVFSALLLMRILVFLQIPGALLVAAIFALHPIQVESVAWITEQKNTLSGVFFLSAALIYLRFDDKRKKRLYASALILFIFGLMSKSVIATLPVSLLAIFWWKRGRIDWKRDVIPLLPFFAIGFASGLFTAWVERKFIGAEGSAFAFTFIERCLIDGRVFWFYLGKLIWPSNLIFIYPRWNVSQTSWWQYLFPIATLILAGTVWKLRRQWRAPLAAVVCYVAAIFPVMGFFNVYPFRFSFVADHFQYLACIAPITMFIVGMDRVLGLLKRVRRFLKPAVVAILLLSICIMTWKQSRMYSNAEILYRTTSQKNSKCWMAYNNLGILMEKAGRTDEAFQYYYKALEIYPEDVEARNNLGNILFQTGRSDEALAQYLKVLNINPKYTVTYTNIGILYAKTGRINDALTYYQKALEISPDYIVTHINIALLLAKIGRTDEAIAHYKKALEINPNYYEAHKNIGNLLEKKGYINEAIIHYLKAVEINPDNSDAQFELGSALANVGRIDEAITHYKKALIINPNYSEAHYNLGSALVKTSQINEAITHFRKAVEFNPNYYEAYYNLATALLQTGHIDEAITYYQKALEIHPDNAITMHNLAIALAKKGDLAEAILLLRKAFALLKSPQDEPMKKVIMEKIDLFSRASRSSSRSSP